DCGFPGRCGEQMQSLIRGEGDLGYHCPWPGDPDFPCFFPEAGICGVDLRAQVVSREAVSPADVPGIFRRTRRAVLLQGGVDAVNRERSGVDGSRPAAIRLAWEETRSLTRARAQRNKPSQEDK